MRISKGQLIINNTEYRNELTSPDAEDLLNMSKESKKQADATKLHASEQAIERGSKFIGYACEAENIDQVRSAYIKMRLMHGQANHIMCGYRFTGHGPHNQNYIDDKEHGGGRTVLNLIKAKKWTNTAIFVVRYYGGVHLGADRFQLITECANEAYETMINTSFEEQDEMLNQQHSDHPESPTAELHFNPEDVVIKETTEQNNVP